MRSVSMWIALSIVSLGTLAVQPRAFAAKAAAKPAPKAAKSKGASTAAPKMAVCPVCAVKEGKKMLEPVKASLKYKGKMYYFCNLQDKAEFISNPSKYAAAVK